MSLDSARPRLSRVLAFAAVALGSALLTLWLWGPARLPALTPEALSSARARWQAVGIGAYTLKLEIEGSELAPSIYEVQARAGSVVSLKRDGQDLTSEREFYGIPGLLRLLAQEIELAKDPGRSFGAPPGYQAHLFARFDVETGCPLAFRRVVGGSGRYSEWRVLEFAPAP